LRWHPEKFIKKTEEAALDGIEEWARTIWLSQAKEDCPVALRFGGTMRNSLGVVREGNYIKIGGGGPARDYIYRQEMDRNLNHRDGQKAGFIRDSATMHKGKIIKFVEKHTR